VKLEANQTSIPADGVAHLKAESRCFQPSSWPVQLNGFCSMMRQVQATSIVPRACSFIFPDGIPAHQIELFNFINYNLNFKFFFFLFIFKFFFIKCDTRRLLNWYDVTTLLKI
jgi:hypothetical protein